MARALVRVLVLCAGLWLLTTRPAVAQRLEAGAHVTVVNVALTDTTQAGGGARLGVQLGPWVVAEGEVTRVSGGDTVTGAMTQVFAGVKLGARSQRFGLFAKLRPGIARFAGDFLPPGTVCIAVFPTPDACLARRTAFAFDLGSVAEFYPTAATLLRVDVGSTHLWYRPRGSGDRQRQGNLQMSIGAGVRF